MVRCAGAADSLGAVLSAPLWIARRTRRPLEPAWNPPAPLPLRPQIQSAAERRTRETAASARAAESFGVRCSAPLWFVRRTGGLDCVDPPAPAPPADLIQCAAGGAKSQRAREPRNLWECGARHRFGSRAGRWVEDCVNPPHPSPLSPQIQSAAKRRTPQVRRA